MAWTDPLTLPCGLTLKHRVSLAPLTNVQSHTDGTLGDDELQWLVHRAKHFGLLSTCAAFVSEEGHAWDGQLGIASDQHAPGLRRLAAALNAEGCQPIVQLHHGGAKADLAPRKLTTADSEGMHGATLADIERVRNDFVSAALRAQDAGFQGVEVHGANGYLFTQFLAPADNPRTDDYGGNLEGRARFLRETLRAVRAAVKPGFAVGVRISPVDTWARRGLVLDDAVALSGMLATDGVDFVHLSLRDASGPPPFEEDKPSVVSAVRSALPNPIALIVAGGMATPADVEKALSEGADIAALGRAAIIHPDWPTLARNPSFVPTSPPWSHQQLREASVGAGLLRYLGGFRGLIEES